jgi:sulfonate transport system ATP-binding protein
MGTETGIDIEPKAQKTEAGVRLDIHHLDKAFGARQVLQGVSLSVEPGQFIAIVGKSGCGKSTLLRLLAGLETPDHGAVLLDNEPLAKQTEHVRLLFQDARLLPWKRVLDNVVLGSSKDLKTLQARQQHARQALLQVGLAKREREWPRVLSGGERQRVALSRVLVSEPRLLLLDEPLGALDALTRLEMQRLLESLWQTQGYTAVLVTHDVEEAVALADRVVMIEQGQITLNVAVDLPRPRDRVNASFNLLKADILNRLLENPPLPTATNLNTTLAPVAS